MAKRKIVQDGDEILRKKCKPVTEFNEKLHVLLDDMLETMRAANGVGLAGSQVGILRRVAVVSVEPETVYDLVNPEILETEGEQEDVEGCLSFPGIWGIVKRPYRVKVRAQNRNGEWYEVEGEGLLARAFCHEIDHLDGHVFTEKVTRFVKEEELK